MNKYIVMYWNSNPFLQGMYYSKNNVDNNKKPGQMKI